MIYAVYFVPRDGVHPVATLDDYRRLWPIMKASVNKLGHKLVHLTDEYTQCWGDSVWRTNVDAAKTVFSRDVAWLRYVAQLPEGEQACMIEPDTVLLKDIPPIKDGFDFVLLKRSKPVIPGWFKLAKKSAVPFLMQVVHEYLDIPECDHTFHGDIEALHRAVKRFAWRIEWRDWTRYGFRKAPHLDPYLLQYKGTSKHEMKA